MKLELLNAISLQLDSVFKNVTIYFDHVSQGFQKPCFCVKCVKNEEKRLLSNRYKVFNKIEIDYFSENIENNTEKCNEILSVLYEEFFKISFQKGTINGENIESFIDENGILRFYIDYNFYIFRFDKVDKMQNMFIQ